jgi:hypothetical protein
MFAVRISIQAIGGDRQPDGHGAWITQEQAARELKVSDTVVKRLIREGILPAKQVVMYAPWVIQRQDLLLPAVQRQVKGVRRGRRLPQIAPEQEEFSLE